MSDRVIALHYVDSKRYIEDPLIKPLARGLVEEISRGIKLKLKSWFDGDSDGNLTNVIGNPIKNVHMGKNKSLGDLFRHIICVIPYDVDSAYYNIIIMSINTLNGSTILYEWWV